MEFFQNTQPITQLLELQKLETGQKTGLRTIRKILCAKELKSVFLKLFVDSAAR